MILELRQPLPLRTPRGKALAYFVIDMGTESHLQWVCFMRDSGECRTFRNPDVRLEANETMGVSNGGGDGHPQ